MREDEKCTIEKCNIFDFMAQHDVVCKVEHRCYWNWWL